MSEYKQSTAATVTLPAPVDTNGAEITDLTGLTIYLKKNGGSSAARNDATAVTQDANTNDLNVSLDGTDFDTLGNLRGIARGLTDQLPCWRDVSVISSNEWNSKYGANLKQVDAFEIYGSEADAETLSQFLGKLTLGAIDTATIQDGAFTAPKFADNALEQRIMASGFIRALMDAVRGGRTLWVLPDETNANDANDGHYQDQPKSTLASAAAAARSGDWIFFEGAAAFNETLDVWTADKALTICGFGASRSVIQANGSGGAVVRLGHRCTLINCKVEQLGTADNDVAVLTQDADDVAVQNCQIAGTFDGVKAVNSLNLMIDGCRITGTYDGINLQNATEFRITNSTISTDSTFNSGNQETRGIVAFGGLGTETRGTIASCNVSATRNDSVNDRATIGISIGGAVKIEDCIVSAAQNGAGTGNVYAVGETDDLASSGWTSVEGGRLSSTGNGTNVYDLHTSNVALAVVDVDHDTSKTSGTITTPESNVGQWLGEAPLALDTQKVQVHAVSGAEPLGTAMRGTDNALLAATYTAPDNATITSIDGKADTISTNVDTLLSRITSTLFSGITSLSSWLGGLAGKSTDAATLAEINATTGGATFDNTTDSPEAIRDVVALTGADGDTLKSLSDQVDGVSGASGGSGAYTVTVTVTDGSSAIEGAKVRYTNGVTSHLLTTNASGQVEFNLDAATWTVAITASGHTFGGTTHVVTSDSATHTATHAMTAVAITPPSDPDQATGYCNVYDEDNALEAGVTFTVTLKTAPSGTGKSYSITPKTYASDADGLLEITDMWQGAVYKVERAGGAVAHVTVPESSTFELPAVLGS